VADWENSTEKLILYAAKNSTDQLRAIYGITTVPGSLKQWREEGMLKASISMRMKSGRTDSDIAVIPMERYSRKQNRSYTLSGAQLANAEMHVVTKAKRRTTLALCGLGGIVDESELDTMKVIGGTTPDGRIFRYEQEDEAVGPRERAQAIAAEKVADLTEKKANASQMPQEPQAAPTEKKAPIVREVEVRTLTGDAFAVTGYLEDIQMSRFLSDVAAKSFVAKADGRTWWQMEDRYRAGFDTLCQKLELKVLGAK
jgi:hypothetical protein